jgi:hypothetical protein|nr:MAG TPA: tail protein [Caudoviricetes sp.]
MTITFFVNGRPLTSVTPEDTSYRYRKISGEDRVYLTFVADRLTTIPVGATIRFEGATYTLLSPAVITKHNNKSYHHSLTLGAPCERLRLWRMKHRTDGAVKFNLTAKPEEHLRMLIDAASGADTEAEKWTIASCLDAPEKLISYDHTDCLSALGLIAKTFDTEWVAEGKAIRLGKIEANATSPLPLSYGKDKGLKSGLKRENDQRQTLIQRLYVRGSDRNIRHDRYGSKTLHMPKSESVFFDGDRFSGEAGYNTRTQALYLVSPNGDYVERVSSEGLTGGEGSLDATDIYPSRVGSVTSFEQLKGETKDKHPLFAFTDTSIPDSLDYTQCLIPNQPLTIAFQSGMLAGQTFESEYTHKDRRFTIIGKEVDGVWMPEAPYIAKAGDKYAVFSVELPAPYIRDNNTKTGAEWELLRRALKHLHEATQHPYVYRADLDGLWAKKDWTNRGGAIRLGGYVRLSDPELIPYGVDLRITGIKDYLISPETPEIELGTGVSASSILTTIEQMRQEGARQEEAVKEVRQEGSRNYKQALEASEQIARATAERFSSSISPATIKTMQLIAGDPQTQLRFKTPANWTPEYNKDTRVLRLPAGQIEWLYNPSRTLSSSEPNAGKVWALPEMRTPALSDPNKSYYIYARCNNGVGASLAGAFVVDTNPRELNDGSATCLLLGLLSSADETGARSFSRLYGFTEVLPGQIRTDKIATPDGTAYFDLQSGVIASKIIRFVYPDGSLHEYPNDYLHEAIKEGSTEIQGGLILSSIIGAKDNTGAVVSYLSGTSSLPAFACGVTGFGTDGYKAITELRHNGTGHIGAMHIDQGGRVITFKSEEKDSCDVRIGGSQSDLKDLLSKSFQDTLIVKGVAKKEISKPSFDTTVSKETIVQVSFSSQNDGAVFEFELPWDISIRHENSAANKINSFCKIQVSIVKSTGETVYDFSDYIKSGDNIVGVPSRINVPLKDSVRGLYAGSYTLSISVQVSSTLVSGAGYSGSPAFTRLVSQPFQMAYRVLGRNKDIKEAVFGRYGFSAFYGHDKLFYMQSDPKAGEKFLTIRGSVNMPGILLSGEFWVIGARDEIFSECTFGSLANGAIRCVRVDRGAYEIHHNLGYDNYTVQITPMWRPGYDSSNRVMARMEGKGENSFKVITAVAGEKNNYVPFSVLVLGNNFKQ